MNDVATPSPDKLMDLIHDSLVERDYPNHKSSYGPEELLAVWKRLPRDLQLDAHRWGFSDTVVRDEVYAFLEREKTGA